MNKAIKRALLAHRKFNEGLQGGKRFDLEAIPPGERSLQGESLADVVLSEAFLEGAVLITADLRRADLSRAVLTNATLADADLEKAKLRGANLRDADLRAANLRGADLRAANLNGADMSDADIDGAILPPLIVPTSGLFHGWKKVRNGVVLELLISAKKPRTGSYVGRKCRAQKVKVLRAFNSNGKEIKSKKRKYESMHQYGFYYKVGEWIEEPNYNGDPRVECAPGIHFFMTKEEARAY